MRARTVNGGLVVMILLAGWGSYASADVAATVNTAAITWTDTSGGQSIAWRFFVDETITITHLGLLDLGAEGLATAHLMGIWHVKSTGGLELERWVWVGPGGVREDDHVYVALDGEPGTHNAPITVDKYPERYLVGVWSPSDNADTLVILLSESVQLAGVITLQDCVYKTWLSPPDPVCGDIEHTETDWVPWGDTSGYYFGVNFRFSLPGPEPTPIDVDIKPGSYPNTINLGSNGVVPVAILSTATFDATTVDPATVTLAGAEVAVRGKGNRYMASNQDVNADGLLDLVLQVETENLDEGTFQDGMAVLQVHETSDPESAVVYEGWDEITIVPPE